MSDAHVEPFRPTELYVKWLHPLERLARVVLLGRVDEALAAAVEMQVQLEDQLVRLVGEARAQGWQWKHIGDALGVTSAGAHSRYAALVPQGDGGRAAPPQQR